MKKLIAYDLDGTLADTRRDIADSVNFMLSEMGRSPLSQKEIEGYVGRGLRELIVRALRTEDPREIERGSKIYRRRYEEHMMDHTRLYEHALAVLEHFRNRKQAVVTNKPNPFTEQMLVRLEVRGFFCFLIAGDPGVIKKPDPGAFLAMMKAHGASPEETLFVGDSVIDIETGRRAGVETVVVCHGFTPRDELESHRPDFIAEDFREVLRLAGVHGW